MKFDDSASKFLDFSQELSFDSKSNPVDDSQTIFLGYTRASAFCQSSPNGSDAELDEDSVVAIEDCNETIDDVINQVTISSID